MSITMQHIKTDACPECGCREVVKVELKNKHVSGQWNERMKFECGLMLHYSPNMGQVNVEEDCRKSASAIEWKRQRKELAAVMIQAAKDHTKRPEAYLVGLESNLLTDLDMWRKELEVVTP